MTPQTSLGMPRPRFFKVTDTASNPNKTYCHIKFYTSIEEETYAEFIGEDPFGTVTAAGLDGAVRDGAWSSLNIGMANASVYKRSKESKITLTADSISKTATLTYSAKFSVDVKGTLFFQEARGPQ